MIKFYTEKPFDRVVASQAVTVNLAGVIYDKPDLHQMGGGADDRL